MQIFRRIFSALLIVGALFFTTVANADTSFAQKIQEYTKVIELNPNLDYPYRNRGLAYCELKQYERAIQDFDKSL